MLSHLSLLIPTHQPFISSFRVFLTHFFCLFTDQSTLVWALNHTNLSHSLISLCHLTYHRTSSKCVLQQFCLRLCSGLLPLPYLNGLASGQKQAQRSILQALVLLVRISRILVHGLFPPLRLLPYITLRVVYCHREGIPTSLLAAAGGLLAPGMEEAHPQHQVPTPPRSPRREMYLVSG